MANTRDAAHLKLAHGSADWRADAAYDIYVGTHIGGVLNEQATCPCELVTLADVARADQLTAEYRDPDTSQERRQAILDQFEAELQELTDALARLTDEG